jgi:2-polyprenyl-3-methyl-5-hydroxy-6-metoxy-1,4-benzoquinol methylase
LDYHQYATIRNLDASVEAELPNITVSVCRRCGLVYQNPCPEREVLLGIYRRQADKISTVDSESVTETECRARVGMFRGLLPPPANVLEIGCSDGLLLQLLAKNGYAVTGVEASEENIARLRRLRPSLRVLQGALEEVELAEVYDAICHFFVLEHSFDPIGFMKKSKRYLKPNGAVMFEVPNLDVFITLPFVSLLFPYQHVVHLTPHSLTNLLARSGFWPRWIDRKPGSSPKAYGMQVVAIPTDQTLPLQNHYDKSMRLLDAYFQHHDTAIQRVVRLVETRLRRLQGAAEPVVIFGAGENGRTLVRTLELDRQSCQVFFCDNDVRLQGTMIDGMQVLNPSSVPALNPGAVILASSDYQEDMARQLVAAGFPEGNLVRLYEREVRQ